MSDSRTVEFLPAAYLEFDPENPRLPERLKNESNETTVLEWMIDKGVIQELMVAIGEYGYFVGEPLLVVRKEMDENRYIVVEGNRRLAAVKLLLNPELVGRKSIAQIAAGARSDRPESVPCVIFPTRDEILRYLGYRHVTGIREWSALAKARYLQQLFPTTQDGSLEDKLRELARAIGSRSDYVARLLTGLSLYEKIEENSFFHIDGLNEDTISFSILTTAASYANIANYLGLEDSRDPDLEGLNDSRLENLTTWIFSKENGKTRIGESRNLRELNKIVAYPVALSKFEEGTSLSEAVSLTEIEEETDNTSKYRKVITDAKARLMLANDYIDLATGILEDDLSDLSELNQMVNELQITIRIKLS